MNGMTDQEKLADAEKALHDLLTGNSVAYVRDSSGEAVSYTKAEMGKLNAYIEQLKQKINTTTRRPLNVWL